MHVKEVSDLLDEMLRKLPRDRDYNDTFQRISEALQKYSLTVPALDLRFRFTLFMQEEFDAIPKELWRIDDPAWLAEKERGAKIKLLTWIQESVGENKV
jgi:hypothetical protein